MKFLSDPFGFAIHDYNLKKNSNIITVKSDLCDDDEIPVSYLFRAYQNMPEIERIALDLCQGETLDIGAGAGSHSIYLKGKGLSSFAIDTSAGAIEYLKSLDIKCQQIDIYNLEDKKYDSIICLMNGLGIAGTYDNVPHFLLKLKTLLNKHGKILIDSTDIAYLF